MNNQLFTPGRFALCMRKDLGENSRRYMLFSLLIAGSMLAISLIIAFSFRFSASVFCESPEAKADFVNAAGEAYSYHEFHDLQKAWLSIILLTTTAVAGSLAFSTMASKEGILKTFSTPASQFEKFISRFVIFVIGAWLVNIASWFLAENLTYWLFSAFTSYGRFYTPESLGPWFNDNVPTFLNMIAIPIFIQSFFFLGSIVWPRNSYVKSFGAGMLIFGCMALITTTSAVYATKTFLPNGNIDPGIFDDIRTFIALALIMAVTNYIIAYVRFRETDIARKW